ncbi:hypothetical protein PENTCL1PPCAC_16417, partial [Pristionchus entomophagus]
DSHIYNRRCFLNSEMFEQIFCHGNLSSMRLQYLSAIADKRLGRLFCSHSDLVEESRSSPRILLDRCAGKGGCFRVIQRHLALVLVEDVVQRVLSRCGRLRNRRR